ncbi:MAG: hypothetical protein MAG581_02203 [Deltaproteobacteria bacterium]|jgi:hypothetical protein|nr:hypothetical protein [Deltaproteobacteria bacterium]
MKKYFIGIPDSILDSDDLSEADLDWIGGG